MSLDPKRVQSVFLKAIEAPSHAERAAVLDRECGPDTDLRQRVEALLRAHDEPGSFSPPAAAPPGATPTLPQAADGPFPSSEYDEPATAIGTVIAGKYKLIEAIGEGGMGSVYMAQQTEPVRRMVAVKVIKAGMD